MCNCSFPSSALNFSSVMNNTDTTTADWVITVAGCEFICIFFFFNKSYFHLQLQSVEQHCIKQGHFNAFHFRAIQRFLKAPPSVPRLLYQSKTRAHIHTQPRKHCPIILHTAFLNESYDIYLKLECGMCFLPEQAPDQDKCLTRVCSDIIPSKVDTKWSAVSLSNSLAIM